MWHRFKEQIPAIVIIVVAMGAFGAWLFNRALTQQAALIQPLRDENQALQAQADDNRRELEATTSLLRQAVAGHEGELFKTDQEIAQLNRQRIDALATAIAQKVAPEIPGPRTPEEIAQLETAQADRIGDRVAERIGPALSELGQSQRESVAAVEQGDRQQIQSLDSRLVSAEGAAQDALQLSHDVTNLYLNSYNDQGVLVRVLSLPANLIRDTVTGNLIDSRDRAKEQAKLDAQMQALEKRLNEIQNSGAMATSS